MSVRTVVAVLAGLAFVSGLVFQMLPLAMGGLMGLLVAVVIRAGRNPLAEAYRDVREPLPGDNDR